MAKIGSFNRDPNFVPDTRTSRGKSLSYEDTSFTTGDSPVVHDVNTDLGRNSRDGYISNDGSGSLVIQFSDDGITYGSTHTLKSNEVMYLDGLDIDSIKIVWVADTSYRIMVV